jgi:hypothetical protein
MGTGVDRVWKLHGDGRTVEPGAVVKPNERLHMPNMLGLGGQTSSRCSGPPRSCRC